MKKTILMGMLGASMLLSACSNTPQTDSQSTAFNTKLSVTSFAEQLKAQADALVLDVRTAEEFNEGHLENALNADWSSNDFEQLTASFDKEKPVFVYCLSGARSAQAAEFLRSKGFKTVYNMEGGIMQWRAAHLPLAGAETKLAGMSQEQFNKLIQSDKVVLVDFYADWCAPCKKMEPYLNEIAQEMKAKVEVVRINADDNPEICQALGVDALPTLKVYKKGQQTWSNVGYIDKPNVLKQL